ncbi:peptidoglycan-binding domain-containing protein [Oscillatoria salina]|uniref:peptidoglycan-binding domain-containing protein n=1 Tax=Oscillatoria salina TaxID=331517 RepID=UPI0013B8C98A|nr:peptidoglycan-binding domain-containing protein [Oscillatoria salina]MBZ8180838.1 peptidoglycan-binding protein [Oscillatoria salina IIICB1]NET90094.1 peptidoglycan-binding protein [Kamptonema sp. SIO1D9]
METLAYLHLAEAYEDSAKTWLTGLNWQKIGSGWIKLLAAILAVSILSVTSKVMALQRGSQSVSVVQLQNTLKVQGFFPANVPSTGYYGATTETAVRNYQQAAGLAVDGIAGARTLEKLYGRTTAPVQTSNCRLRGYKSDRSRDRPQLNFKTPEKWHLSQWY